MQDAYITTNALIILDFFLLQCKDYEKYLSEIGTGPLSRVMVMRASVVVNITQVLSSFSKLHIMKVPVLSRQP